VASVGVSLLELDDPAPFGAAVREAAGRIAGMVHLP
jgi:hypothetical protein